MTAYRWRCTGVSRDICPFHGVSFCGDEKEEPRLLSYHPRVGGLKECYIQHITLCWEKWKELKRRYLPSIQRVLKNVGDITLRQGEIEKFCGLLILHHDIGKLSEEYQKKMFLRHEILSAYFIYQYVMTFWREMGLSDYECKFLRSISAAATYLHHEALQLSHHHLELRAPTYSYLLSILLNRKFSMLHLWNDITSKLEELALGTCHVYLRFEGQISGPEVAGVLGEVVTYIDGSFNTLAVRVAVASVLQPLTICDNLAASARGGLPSRLSKFLGAGEI